MRSLIGSALVVLAVAGVVAGVSRLSPAAPGSEANEAAARHHLASCQVCRDSGITVTELARPGCPNPCNLDDRGCTLGPANY